MSSDDGGVDVGQGVHGGEGDVEDTEQRHETWVHLVPASPCLQGVQRERELTV